MTAERERGAERRAKIGEATAAEAPGGPGSSLLLSLSGLHLRAHELDGIGTGTRRRPEERSLALRRAVGQPPLALAYVRGLLSFHSPFI